MARAPVRFLERVSPALEHVDSSSGAIPYIESLGDDWGEVCASPELLEEAPYDWWHHRRYGVRALVAMGRKAEALRYAEASRGRNDHPGPGQGVGLEMSGSQSQLNGGKRP